MILNLSQRNAQHQSVTVKTSFASARVYGPLTTSGKVNSRHLQDIVLLNSSPTIESSVNFQSLEGSSLLTDHPISSFNFNKWYENVLWRHGKGEQLITGKWKVKQLRLTSDAAGNGLINDLSVSDIEKNLRKSVASIDAAISNHTGKYQEWCQDLRGKAYESQNAIHILKHFTFDFKIVEAASIFSSFAFHSRNENYFAINLNCTTKLYKWRKQDASFKLLGHFVTGVVYDWAVVNNLKQDAFIVTNSRMEANYPCPFGGLNVWKMNDDQLFHVTTISNSTDVLELHVNPAQPGRFFTLNNLDFVTHYDVFGEKKEFWQLPMDNYNYSFVPPEVTSDLTLYNGQKLFVLESKFKNRAARFLWEDAQLLKIFRNKTRPGDSPMYTVKMPKPIQKSKSTNTLPSIPATPLTSTNDRQDFVLKIRQVGDAMRRSLSETFSNVPKLKIKNVKSNAESKEHRNESNDVKLVEPKEEEEAELGLSVEPSTTAEPAEVSTKSDELGEPNIKDDFDGFIKTIKSVAKGFRNFGTTPKGTETHSKAHDKKLLDREVFRENYTKNNPPTMHFSVTLWQTQMPTAVTEAMSIVEEKSTVMEAQDALVDNTETKEGTELKDRAEDKATKDPARDSSTKDQAEDSDSKDPSEPSEDNVGKVKDIKDSLKKVGHKVKEFFTLKEANTNDGTETAVKGSESNVQTSTKEFDSPPKPLLSESQVFHPTPQIFLPSNDENEEIEDFVHQPTKFPEVPPEDDVLGSDQQVPHEVLSGSGLRATENKFLPERGAGEFLMMFVGTRNQKRALYAVTENRQSIIKGNHNVIEVKFRIKQLKSLNFTQISFQVYNDIFTGSYFQPIHCSDPSNLVSLQFRDETLFAFLESRSEVHVYIYRGIQGFVKFKQFKLPGYAAQMTALSLPPKIDYECDRHYLVVRMETEIIFFSVEIAGNCGLSEVHCDVD